MLLTTDAAGVHVIATTPFDDQGAIDWDSCDRMVDFYLGKGADGLVLLGVMGEAPKLTQAESRAVVAHILRRVAGRIPVTVGVSAPGFAAMAELTGAVMDLGAGGVMIAPPSSLRTDDQIVTYYRQAAEMLPQGTPIIVQDFPLVTGVQMAVPVLRRIVEAVPGVVCIKHEDWPGLDKITALRADGAMPRRVSILCGNGGAFLPDEIARGADGAMTGYAYPEMMLGVIAAVRAGDMDRAHDIYDAHLPLIMAEMQPGLGLAVRKHALWRRGLLASPALRRPGAVLTPATAAEIDRVIARLERRMEELG